MNKQYRVKMVYKEKWLFPGTMLALPALLLMIAFIVLPLFMNIGYVFTDYNLTSTIPRFIGLTNFKNMFLDRDFLLVATNTLKLMLTYIFAVNLLAIIVGILLAKMTVGFGNFVKTVIYFPQLLSMVVVGFTWKILFNFSNGPINKLLLVLGVAQKNLPQWLGDPSLIMPTIAIVVLWFQTGYYSIIYYTGMMNIPQEYYEVSAIEGANKWQELRYITLPFLAPSITINTVLLTIASISSFALPAALTTGGGPGRYGTTISLWTYNTYFFGQQYGKSLAISVFLSLFAILVALVEMKILLKREVNG